MSECRYCAGELFWAGDLGRWEPYEHSGRALVRLGNQILATDTYVPHVCAERQEVIRTRTADMAEMREEVTKLALERECPKCGAGVEVMCWNLTERKKGIAVATVWPHPERIPAEVGWRVTEARATEEPEQGEN